MRLRRAHLNEASTLSTLAFDSKRIWGYDDEFMERCRSELVVREDDIAHERVVVAVSDDDQALGFYSLKDLGQRVVELDMLFVAPDHVRQGVGGVLMEDALQGARRGGWSRLRIESDPYAAAFYERQGATLVGTATSPSTGRALPLFEVDLDGHDQD